MNTDPKDHQEQNRVSKVWLITGSSRGLGRAFTEAALEAGHRVVATARNPQQLVDVVSAIERQSKRLRDILIGHENVKRSLTLDLLTGRTRLRQFVLQQTEGA